MIQSNMNGPLKTTHIKIRSNTIIYLTLLQIFLYAAKFYTRSFTIILKFLHLLAPLLQHKYHIESNQNQNFLLNKFKNLPLQKKKSLLIGLQDRMFSISAIKDGTGNQVTIRQHFKNANHENKVRGAKITFKPPIIYRSIDM